MTLGRSVEDGPLNAVARQSINRFNRLSMAEIVDPRTLSMVRSDEGWANPRTPSVALDRRSELERSTKDSHQPTFDKSLRGSVSQHVDDTNIDFSWGDQLIEFLKGRAINPFGCRPRIALEVLGGRVTKLYTALVLCTLIAYIVLVYQGASLRWKCRGPCGRSCSADSGEIYRDPVLDGENPSPETLDLLARCDPIVDNSTGGHSWTGFYYLDQWNYDVAFAAGLSSRNGSIAIAKGVFQADGVVTVVRDGGAPVTATHTISIDCSGFTVDTCSWDLVHGRPVGGDEGGWNYSVSVVPHQNGNLLLPPNIEIDLVILTWKASYTKTEGAFRVVFALWNLYLIPYFLWKSFCRPSMLSEWLSEQVWGSVVVVLMLGYINPLFLPGMSFRDDTGPAGNAFMAFELLLPAIFTTVFYGFIVSIPLSIAFGRIRWCWADFGSFGGYFFPSVLIGALSLFLSIVAVIDFHEGRGIRFLEDVHRMPRSTSNSLVRQGGDVVVLIERAFLAASGVVLVLSLILCRVQMKQWVHTQQRMQILSFRIYLLTMVPTVIVTSSVRVQQWLQPSNLQPIYNLSPDTLPDIILNCVVCLTLLHFYVPIYSGLTMCPPPPHSQAWIHWKWSVDWYSWWVHYGKSLYFFITEEENRAFDQARMELLSQEVQDKAERIFDAKKLEAAVAAFAQSGDTDDSSDRETREAAREVSENSVTSFDAKLRVNTLVQKGYRLEPDSRSPSPRRLHRPPTEYSLYPTATQMCRIPTIPLSASANTLYKLTFEGEARSVPSPRTLSPAKVGTTISAATTGASFDADDLHPGSVNGRRKAASTALSASASVNQYSLFKTTPQPKGGAAPHRDTPISPALSQPSTPSTLDDFPIFGDACELEAPPPEKSIIAVEILQKSGAIKRPTAGPYNATKAALARLADWREKEKAKRRPYGNPHAPDEYQEGESAEASNKTVVTEGSSTVEPEPDKPLSMPMFCLESAVECFNASWLSYMIDCPDKDIPFATGNHLCHDVHVKVTESGQNLKETKWDRSANSVNDSTRRTDDKRVVFDEPASSPRSKKAKGWKRVGRKHSEEQKPEAGKEEVPLATITWYGDYSRVPTEYRDNGDIPETDVASVLHRRCDYFVHGKKEGQKHMHPEVRWVEAWLPGGLHRDLLLSPDGQVLAQRIDGREWQPRLACSMMWRLPYQVACAWLRAAEILSKPTEGSDKWVDLLENLKAELLGVEHASLYLAKGWTTQDDLSDDDFECRRAFLQGQVWVMCNLPHEVPLTAEDMRLTLSIFAFESPYNGASEELGTSVVAAALAVVAEGLFVTRAWTQFAVESIFHLNKVVDRHVYFDEARRYRRSFSRSFSVVEVIEWFSSHFQCTTGEVTEGLDLLRRRGIVTATTKCPHSRIACDTALWSIRKDVSNRIVADHSASENPGAWGKGRLREMLEGKRREYDDRDVSWCDDFAVEPPEPDMKPSFMFDFEFIHVEQYGYALEASVDVSKFGLKAIVISSPLRVILAFRGTNNGENIRLDLRLCPGAFEAEDTWSEFVAGMKQQARRMTKTVFGCSRTAAPASCCGPQGKCTRMLALGHRAIFGDKPQCHEGFIAAWAAMEASIYEVVGAICPVDDPRPLFVTGHSLGGALAQIAAYYLTWKFYDQKKTAKVYAYASPRVGNFAFAASYDTFVPETFRINVNGDPVTNIPPSFGLTRYRHAGTEVQLGRGETASWCIAPTWLDSGALPMPRPQSHFLGEIATKLNKMLEHFDWDAALNRTLRPGGDTSEGRNEPIVRRRRQTQGFHNLDSTDNGGNEPFGGEMPDDGTDFAEKTAASMNTTFKTNQAKVDAALNGGAEEAADNDDDEGERYVWPWVPISRPNMADCASPPPVTRNLDDCFSDELSV
ncbi:Lipase [Diplonema papillatum]|nr:Lipase [Diplonema papillatum]